MDQASTPRADPPPRLTERPAALAALAGLLALGAAGLWLWDRPEVAGRLLAGLGASLLIGLAARRQDWLTPSGVLGAVLTGSLVFGGGGLAWGGLLLVFFVLANGLSRLRRRQKERLAVAPAKGARRDLGQVLANGGLGAALAAAAIIQPAPALFIAFVGAMAAVTADTWSTEVGLLGGRVPRLITTGRRVPPGANGGVTLPGTLAGAAGGLTIGLAALALAALTAGWGEVTVAPAERAWLPLCGLVTGLGGGLVDSLLGATVQAVRHCPACDAETEHAVHHCGTPTRPRRGLPWLDNDRVNAAASLAGALLALGLWRLI